MSAQVVPKWFPSETVSAQKKTRKASRPQKLRASLVPGTVLILLAGRFRGKRVVYLKNLEDNTLLVSGPFKVNGVPLRRVNARYVIATSTKVAIDSVNVEKFNVEYFARDAKLSKKEKKEAQMFPENTSKEVKSERIEDQKNVDKALLSEIKKTPLLKQYLASSFYLKNGDKPHMLKF
ncbi:60S ribosomal protein L6A [Maudiozyma exigua]|uniref:60S ribosomal protein L6 n=1 Tax=Maudiozyma exigua TaxID=34358 RepID=A0A9P6W1Y2_MAUEX|nr:60S ribosomal protein L6A [Kazachstania exigua]